MLKMVNFATRIAMPNAEASCLVSSLKGEDLEHMNMFVREQLLTREAAFGNWFLFSG